jgi:hypothetical protein
LLKHACIILDVLQPWIEKSVKNRLIFIKTGETGPD